MSLELATEVRVAMLAEFGGPARALPLDGSAPIELAHGGRFVEPAFVPDPAGPDGRGLILTAPALRVLRADFTRDGAVLPPGPGWEVEVGPAGAGHRWLVTERHEDGLAGWRLSLRVPPEV